MRNPRSRHGIHLPPQVAAFAAWARGERRYAEATVESCCAVAEEFFKFLAGSETPLDSISIVHVDQAIAAKSARTELSRRTIENYAVRLKMFFRFAEGRGCTAPTTRPEQSRGGSGTAENRVRNSKSCYAPLSRPRIRARRPSSCGRGIRRGRAATGRAENDEPCGPVFRPSAGGISLVGLCGELVRCGTPKRFDELLYPRGGRRCAFAVEQVVDRRDGIRLRLRLKGDAASP